MIMNYYYKIVQHSYRNEIVQKKTTSLDTHYSHTLTQRKRHITKNSRQKTRQRYDRV